MIPNNNHMSGANSVGSQRSRGSRSTITSATGAGGGGAHHIIGGHHATTGSSGGGACQACGVNVTTAFHQVETARRKLELLQEKIQVDQELLRSDKKNFKRRMQAARAAARASQAELESRLHQTMAGSGEQGNSSNNKQSSSSSDRNNDTPASSRIPSVIAQRRDQDWRQVTELRERLKKQELAHNKELQSLKDHIAILQKSNNNSNSSSVPNSPGATRCTSPPLSPPSSPPFLHHPLRPVGASSSPGNKPKSLSPLTSRTAGETVGGGSTAGSTISTQRDSSPTNRSGGRSAVHVIMDRDQRNHAAWLAQQQKHDEKIQLLQLKITTLTQKCDRLEKQLASCKLEQLEEKQLHEANRKEQEQNDQAQASQQRRVQQELKVALESSDKQRMELQRQIKELQEAVVVATKTTNMDDNDGNNKAAASSALECKMLQGKLRECQLQVETLTKQLQQKSDELQLEMTKSSNDVVLSADLVKSQHQVEALTAQLERVEDVLDATRMETEGYKATVDSQTFQIEQLELEKSDLELELQTAQQKVESLQGELLNVSSTMAAASAAETAAAKMAAEQLAEQQDLTPPLAGEYIEHRTSSSVHQQPDPLTHRLVLEHEWHGTELTGVYTGWVDIDTGNPSGNGTLRVDDGAVYDGDWKNGHRHGQGVYATVEGDVYRGEWQDDLYHGTGTFVWSDGRVYRGMYSFGQRQGTGIMCWPYGAHYQGEYQNDKRNGLGQYVYADGRCYNGEYKEDRPHGYGMLKGANGTVIYDGHWELGEQLS